MKKIRLAIIIALCIALAGLLVFFVTKKTGNPDGESVETTQAEQVTTAETVEESVDESSDDSADASGLEDSEFNLKYSKYLDNKAIYSLTEVVDWRIENRKEDTVYSIEIADKSIADTEKNVDGENVIYATGIGSTTVDVYEQLGDSKKRLIGTANINTSEITMAEAVECVIYANKKENHMNSVWLKLNLGKTVADLDEIFKDGLVGNDALGSRFGENDYTLTLEPVESDIMTIEGNKITAVKAGSADIGYKLDFTDGSSFDGMKIPVKVTDTTLETVDGYTLENIRDYVVGLDTPVELADGTKTAMINFDNAATTPALKIVEDTINEELEMYGSIGRGFSQKSNHSTDIYNETRDKVLDFLGADPEFYTCFYVNSTTDGLNKLASALIESEDDIVLTTRIEHHANDLSWRERCKVIYAEVDEKGRVIYEDIEKLLKENDVKVVSISAASNVTGYVNDVHRVAKLAHEYGAQIVVDGAQIVAHRKFSMLGDTPEENIDYIAFSAHKMYSPYGGGAVVGLTEELNKHMPTFYGGGTIKVVGDTWQIYKDAPAAYEAGSPNYPGVVGLGKAIDVLNTVGMDKIEEHEKILNRKMIDGLKKLDNVIIYGDSENIDDRVGVVSFNFSDINSYYLAQALSENGGVATRRGAFCAHPYVWRLMGISDEAAKNFESCADVDTAGMVRVSFGIYNNEEDVDKFLEIMPQIMEKARAITIEKYATPEY